MAKLSDNTFGAVLMMASMASFTLNDACIKMLGSEIPKFQFLFLRGIATTIFLYVLARYMNGFRLRFPLRDWGFVSLRTLSEIGAAFCFVTALRNMPFANVAAIQQVVPLTVAAGGVFLFGEKIGWKRSLAIAVGFCGMLLIVRPGSDGFNVFTFYALGAVVFVTGRDLATRGMSSAVPSLTVALSASVGIWGFSAFATMAETWAPVTSSDAALICGSALFISSGFFFAVLVMRVGDVGFIAPFRYTGLVWALILGVFLFAEWPDVLSLVGAAIVVSTGVFTLYREARRAKSLRT